jgi:hypothetical protein
MKTKFWVKMAEASAAEAPAATATATATPSLAAATPAAAPEAAAAPVDNTSLAAAVPKDGEAAPEASGQTKPGEGETKPEVAPKVEYTDFKIPEGTKITQESLAHFKETMAERGFNQEEAQALLDMHIKDVQDAAQAPYKLWADTQNQWRTEAKNNPEYGGAKFDENMANVAKAIDAVYEGNPKGAQAFRDALNFTGAGNNPAVLSFLYNVSQAYMEGTPAPSGGPVKVNADGTAGGNAMANIMYPSQSESKLANADL